MKKSTLRLVFSKFVYEQRNHFGLTQAQLAGALGVSLRWIQKVESGKKSPGIHLAFRLADFLEFSLDDVLNEWIERSGSHKTASEFIKFSAHIPAESEIADSNVGSYV